MSTAPSEVGRASAVPSTTRIGTGAWLAAARTQVAQVGFWLDRQDFGDGGRVVREVEAVAGADLQDPTLQAGQQAPAVVGDLGVHEVADPRIDAGEQGMMNWSLPSKRAHGHPSEPAGDRD
jgi:hypothetical protein